MTQPTAATPHEDDLFHPVTSDDPTWVETAWFPFWIPEKRLTVYVHLVFMPNRRTYVATVVMWDADNRTVFEQPHRGELPHLRQFGDMDHLQLPNGLSIDCLIPQHRFRVRYTHPDCSFDILFAALIPPVSIPPEESPGMYLGHIDQPGHVTGTFNLRGTESNIDCYSSRDRSWGPRHARSDVRMGNGHSTNKDFFFFVYIHTNTAGEEKITGAYVLHHGKLAKIIDGTRHIDWQGQRARRVTLRFTDTEERHYEITGHCLNQRNLMSAPNLYVVLNLVEWFIDATPIGYGESHDVWSQEAWQATGRNLSV